MKKGAAAAAAIAMSFLLASCGDSGLDGSRVSDSCTDTSGDGWWSDPVEDSWASPEATTDPASDPWSHDAVADAMSDPVTDPVGDPLADTVSTDADEEAELPPEDICDAVITEPQVLYLSADDSNSMASPVIARSLIDQGFLVPAGMVRTYEFTNYYDISYEPADPGRVRVLVHMKPEEEDFYNLQIGAQSHETEPWERRPINLTFIMDTSGSMRGTPIELEQDVCRAIASSLRPGDVVSMVVWDVSDATILDSHPVTGPHDFVLRSVCGSLTASGGTNLHGGLVAGYTLASANYDPAYLNRVVLVSDGQANLGVTDETLIAREAEDEEGEGIYLVGVGVGKGYNDTLMDAVTDAGKGAYVFIDSREEADLIFGERFLSTLEIAAMNVQVQLTLPPWLRIEEFHGEEISGDPKEVEPQHLAPNDAMIFHQLVKACEEPPLDDVITASARYTDPFSRERRTDTTTVTIAELMASQADPQLVKGTAIVEYAEGLKDISDLMRAGDTTGAQGACDSVEASLSLAAAETADPDLADIAGLLGRYCSDVTSRSPTSWY